MVNYLDTQLDAVFGALADPTRRRIVARVAAGPARVTDIAAGFRMSLPAVSKHIRVLEHAGLLDRDRQGRVHRMTLKGDAMKDAAQWLEEYRTFWEGRLDRLAAYLENQPEKESSS